MSRYLFSLDYGETFGYSIIDIESKDLVCIGSTSDPKIIYNIFLTFREDLDILLYEAIAGKESHFIPIIASLEGIKRRYDLPIRFETVSPSVWKNSKFRNRQPLISKHSKDSFRFASYFLEYKLVI